MLKLPPDRRKRKLNPEETEKAKASTPHNRNMSKGIKFEWTPAKLRKREELRERYRDNFLEWAAECVKIIDRDAPKGAALIPFKPAASQLDFLSLREEVKRFQVAYSTKLNAIDGNHPISEKPIEIVCLKARKVYISTIIQLLMTHAGEFYDNTFSLTMAHKQAAAENISGITRRLYKNWSQKELPTAIGLARMSDSLIEWSGTHGSKSVVMTAGSTDESSRSYTYHFIHLSEAAMYPEGNSEIVNAENAAATYREIYTESTAHGEGNAFHDEWDNAMWIEEAWDCLNNNKPFKENWNKKFRWFWAWWQDPGYRIPCLPHEEREIKRTLTEKEKFLMEAYGCDLAQLKWRRYKIAGECAKQKEMSPEEYFCQEYPANPEEAFIAKGKSVFDKMKLKAMMELAKTDKPKFGHLVEEKIFDPDSEQDMAVFKFEEAPFEEGATWFQWEGPIPGNWYVIGGDVSEGLPTGDWSTFTVYDRTDGTFLREVARFIGKPDPDSLAELIKFVAEMYNDAFVNCERNKDGSATNIRLVKLGYAHLYHGRNEEVFKNKENPEVFTAGFQTTPKTKPLLVARGQTALKNNEILIRHPVALYQWNIFQRREGVDRYGAPDGKNDDCVIADLLAIWGDEEGPPVRGPRVTKGVSGLEGVKVPDDQLPPEVLAERRKLEAKQHRQKQFQKWVERNRETAAREDAMRQQLSLDADEVLADTPANEALMFEVLSG